MLLLDRSLTIGDYIELEDGRTGVVRELNMRSTTLETFDGKTSWCRTKSSSSIPFTNWTHKNKSQRYRVDFSVAYHSDVRKLVEIIKQVVASHPQVLAAKRFHLKNDLTAKLIVLAIPVSICSSSLDGRC